MAKKSLVVVINRPGRSGVTSAARMACPYCGKEPMPYALFCDNCGNDLSALWKSTRPLVRQGYDRQWRQGKPAPGLKDGVQDLKSTLSATARQWKLLPKPRGDKGQSESSATPTSGTMPEPKADLAEIASLRQERDKFSEQIRQLETKVAETENLKKERDKLSERTRELETKLAGMVPRSELKAMQSDYEILQAQLSKLREYEAESEAEIEKLADKLARAQRPSSGEKRCRECGHMNPTVARYCRECGTELSREDHPLSQRTSARSVK